jgi:hypothetical protein
MALPFSGVCVAQSLFYCVVVFRFLCLTIFVLSLHFRPEDEPVPNWLKTFTSACLAKLACVKSPCLRRKRSKVGVVEQLYYQ